MLLKCTIALYAVSFALPADGEPNVGGQRFFLVYGASAFRETFLDGGPLRVVWVPNPLLVVGCVALACRLRIVAAVLGTCAVVIATLPPLFHWILYLIFETPGWLLPGFYCWIGSMLLLIAASACNDSECSVGWGHGRHSDDYRRQRPDGEDDIPEESSLSPVR
jgi:hypothetical protein